MEFIKMKIIEYDTEEEALARSKEEAYKKGCNENTITQYWWGVREGTNGKWGLLVGQDSVEEETIEINDDWFKVEEKKDGGEK